MEFVIDPTGHWTEKGVSPQKLQAAMGVLPIWVMEAFTLGEHSTLKQYMENRYGFGALHEMTGGEVDERGVYQYPEDPPMYPYGHMEWDQYTVRFYPYSIVDINGFMTRMD